MLSTAVNDGAQLRSPTGLFQPPRGALCLGLVVYGLAFVERFGKSLPGELNDLANRCTGKVK